MNGKKFIVLNGKSVLSPKYPIFLTVIIFFHYSKSYRETVAM